MLGFLGTLIGLILSLVGAYFINEYKKKVIHVYNYNSNLPSLSLKKSSKIFLASARSRDGSACGRGIEEVSKGQKA